MSTPRAKTKVHPKNPESIKLWKLARIASYLHQEYTQSNDPYAQTLALSALDLRNHSVEAAKRASLSTQNKA
jgi:hypothetical protein